MEVRSVLELCIIVICSISIGVMLYYKVKGNVLAAVSELIALAEKTGLTGSEKMKLVVSRLLEIVPTALKCVFTEERLESIAQCVFDWIRKYAEEYRSRLDALASEKAATETVNSEMAAELISELLNLTLRELEEKAHGYGISLDDHSTKKEYIDAIVKFILEKA